MKGLKMRVLLLLIATLFAASPSLAGCLTPNDGCGGGDVVNRAIDTDGDGNPDYVRVRGDFNGDGLTDTDDIHDAAVALTDTGPKTIDVDAAVYGPPATLTYVGQIALESNTTLRCTPGAVFEGYDIGDLAVKATNSRILTNASVVDPTDRTSTGDGAGNVNITVDGCTAEYPDLGSSYNASAWTVENVFGFYLSEVDGLRLLDNVVDNTQHTCFYTRSSTDTLIQGNTGGTGCGGANETSGTVQHCFYSFASGDEQHFDGARYVGNTCLGAGGAGFHTRSQFACVGGTAEGTACTTDGAQCTGGGTCTQAKILNHSFTGNVALNAGTAGFVLNSLENSTLSGNVVDGAAYGFQFVDIGDGQDLCDGTNPSDDAVCNVTVSGNSIANVTSEAVRLGGGHMGIVFASNTIDTVGSSGTDAIRIRGPFKGHSIIGNSVWNLGASGARDFVGFTTTVSSGDTDLGPLLVSGNHVFDSNVNGSKLFDTSVNLSLSDVSIVGNSTDGAASAQECIDFRASTPSNLVISGNHCGELGYVMSTGFTGSGAMGMFARGTVTQVHEAPSGACENGAIVTVTNSIGDGSTPTDHIYACLTDAWAQLD